LANGGGDLALHEFKSRANEEDGIMGLPNKDEVEGKFDQAKGAVKENVGRAVNDKEMESEGAADRAGGHLQEGYGTAKRKVGETVEDVGEAIKK
jgi:uncharacterized protein YjbJ (UPF0337 family)